MIQCRWCIHAVLGHESAAAFEIAFTSNLNSSAAIVYRIVSQARECSLLLFLFDVNILSRYIDIKHEFLHREVTADICPHSVHI